MVCNLELYEEPWPSVLSNTTVPRDWGKERCLLPLSQTGERKSALKSTKEHRMTSQLPNKTPGQKSCRGRSCQTALSVRSIRAECLGGQDRREPHTVPLNLEMAWGQEARG